MAGVKGRSGPPGNMNGVKRSWETYWRRRALRPADRWVAVEAEKYRLGLMCDKPEATEGERRAIELAAEARACRLLIWDAIKRDGFTRSGDEGLALVSAAEALPKFIGAELGALKLLGLERRAKVLPSLHDELDAELTRQEQTP